MMTLKVGRRGQITLPSEIRRKFGLNEGDRMAIVTQGDQVILYPLTRTLLDLRGSVPVSTPQDFSAVRQQVIKERALKAAGDEV